MTPFASETGGPALDLGVNDAPRASKAPSPVVHLLTSFSSQNVQMASVTISCDAAIGTMVTETERKKPVRRAIMEKADVWKCCTAWYSLTTCPDCLAVVERSA